MTREDGGAAFARTGGMTDGPNSLEWVEPQSGMSLRDYFAAAALTASYINGFAMEHDKRAKEAYAQADAMIRARQG